MNNIKELTQELNKEIKNFKDYQQESIEAVNARADVLENEILNMKTAGLGMPGTGGNDAKMRKDFSDALRIYAKTGDDSRLRNIGNVKNSMSVASDPDGGYTVYPFIDKELMRTAKDLSSIRGISRVVTISKSDELEIIVDRNDVTSAWVAESASRTALATPEIERQKIPVHEQYTLQPVTQKLLDDSMLDLGAWMTEKIAISFAQAENLAFVSGTGLTQPRGFLDRTMSSSGDSTRTWGELQYIPTGASGGFDYTGSPQAPADPLYTLIYALKAEYRQGAVFVMNSATAGEIRKLKDANGRYIWHDSVMAGEPSLLAGYPVTICESMPDIAADSYSVAFGNFARGYCVVDRHGIRLLVDNLTDKPNVLFYAYRRVGGDVINPEAIKTLKFSAS